MAKYDEEMKQEILRQYDIFLNRFRELVNEHGQYEEIVKRFAHILFVTHICHPDCIKAEKMDPKRGKIKECPLKGKVLEPKLPNIWKFLHLIFKEQVLYNGIPDFLHLYLRCTVKTHAEGVVESMGNYVEIHSEKRRGSMGIFDIGKESLIHWNGPPTARADRLGKEALDRIFGQNRWHLISWILL